MFSGIIQELGTVQALRDSRLTLAAQLAADASAGESISVSGVCLTVAARAEGTFTADVMPETLRRTNLGSLRSGDVVNLERSLRLGDVVGGHLVSGHVDAVATVVAMQDDGNARWVTLSAPGEVAALLAVKGSVALDGISLTLVGVMDDRFSVSLIPHTLTMTTAGRWGPGSRVNLEADLVARYVQRLLAAAPRDALGV